MTRSFFRSVSKGARTLFSPRAEGEGTARARDTAPPSTDAAGPRSSAAATHRDAGAGGRVPKGITSVAGAAPTPSSAHQVSILEQAHRVHRFLALARDAATSNAALLDRIATMEHTAGGGGFAAVTQRLVTTTGRLGGHSQETLEAVNAALSELRALQTSIDELEATFTLLRERVGTVEASAGTIAEIAELSHLLSLNARIEASRGGQEAAGFRVVAQEVGNLAQKTRTLSDEIGREVQAMGESIASFGEIFETNRGSLESASTSVSRLESTARGIAGDTEVLAEVTRSVETLAQTQVSIQDGFDTLRRQGEWVGQASDALVTELEAECTAVVRALQLEGAGETWKGLARFRDEMVRALRDDLPALGETLVAEAIAAGSAPESLLAALAEAASRVYLGQSGGEEPLETHYRNARILQGAVDTLEPLVPASFYEGAPVVVIGNAFEDYHDLGRRLVAISMRAAGFKVIDLGLSVPNEKFVETALRENAQVVGVSSLLLHTARWIPELKQALVARGRGDIGVIAGGAPFIVDPDLRARFGADGVGRSPQEAIRLVRQLAARPRGGLATTPQRRHATPAPGVGVARTGGRRETSAAGPGRATSRPGPTAPRSTAERRRAA